MGEGWLASGCATEDKSTVPHQEKQAVTLGVRANNRASIPRGLWGDCCGTPSATAQRRYLISGSHWQFMGKSSANSEQLLRRLASTQPMSPCPYPSGNSKQKSRKIQGPVTHSRVPRATASGFCLFVVGERAGPSLAVLRWFVAVTCQLLAVSPQLPTVSPPTADG